MKYKRIKHPEIRKMSPNRLCCQYHMDKRLFSNLYWNCIRYYTTHYSLVVAFSFSWSSFLPLHRRLNIPRKFTFVPILQMESSRIHSPYLPSPHFAPPNGVSDRNQGSIKYETKAYSILSGCRLKLNRLIPEPVNILWGETIEFVAGYSGCSICRCSSSCLSLQFCSGVGDYSRSGRGPKKNGSGIEFIHLLWNSKEREEEEKKQRERNLKAQAEAWKALEEKRKMKGNESAKPANPVIT
jgi:hypothetical protein